MINVRTIMDSIDSRLWELYYYFTPIEPVFVQLGRFLGNRENLCNSLSSSLHGVLDD
jgi:hypothetical protein